MKWRVSPFNDYIFKKLFGTVGNEELLRVFLNAVGPLAVSIVNNLP